jgi:hypothetical protein
MAQINLAGNIYVRDQLVHVQENGRWKLADGNWHKSAIYTIVQL